MNDDVSESDTLGNVALRAQLNAALGDARVPTGTLEAVMDLRVGVIHPLMDEYLPRAVSV